MLGALLWGLGAAAAIAEENEQAMKKKIKGWHDLREDPQDLPPQGEKVFIADEYSKYHSDREPSTAWREGNTWMSMDEWNKRPIEWKIYAWHEIPKIPEEFLKE